MKSIVTSGIRAAVVAGVWFSIAVLFIAKLTDDGGGYDSDAGSHFVTLLVDWWYYAILVAIVFLSPKPSRCLRRGRGRSMESSRGSNGRRAY